MKLIAEVAPEVITQHLIALGCGNHPNNLKEFGLLPESFGFKHYLTEIDEAEFFGLVFQHTPDLSPLVPDVNIRPLRIAAQNALGQLKVKPRLNANWDLTLIEERTTAWLARGTPLPALALRDSRGSELITGQWYLQDGCHRALGYAMAILKYPSVTYRPLKAYIATTEITFDT